jgi:DNA-directed RNA polymerase specialized sigma24 family protein
MAEAVLRPDRLSDEGWTLAGTPCRDDEPTRGAPAAEPSFEDFFAAERVRLGRALFLLTGDASEADELAQDAMVRIFERWDRVRRADSPVAYLYATAMNLHRSGLRRLRVLCRRRHEACGGSKTLIHHAAAPWYSLISPPEHCRPMDLLKRNASR